MHKYIYELLNEDDELLRTAIRGFVEDEIIPRRIEIDRDREHKIVDGILKKLLVDMGIVKAIFPEELGGAEITSIVSFVQILEEIARGDLGIATAVACTLWPLIPIIYEPYRRMDLLEEFREMFFRDELNLGCFAMTEPQGGCDIENPRMEGRTILTIAKLDGNEWVINGVKQWASNSGVASLYLIVASTDPTIGRDGIALIYVPSNVNGISYSEFFDKAGLNADRNCTVYLENVRVPKRYRVAGPGEDARLLQQNIIIGNIGSAAMSIGAAEAVFEMVSKYTSERVVAGKPIKEHSINAGILADMAIYLETARAYTIQVAYMFDHPEKYGPRWSDELLAKSRIAKIYAAEIGIYITNKAMELMSSYGYVREGLVEKYWRDIKETQIWLGGAQAGRLDIARYFLNIETI